MFYKYGIILFKVTNALHQSVSNKEGKPCKIVLKQTYFSGFQSKVLKTKKMNAALYTHIIDKNFSTKISIKMSQLKQLRVLAKNGAQTIWE